MPSVMKSGSSKLLDLSRPRRPVTGIPLPLRALFFLVSFIAHGQHVNVTTRKMAVQLRSNVASLFALSSGGWKWGWVFCCYCFILGTAMYCDVLTDILQYSVDIMIIVLNTSYRNLDGQIEVCIGLLMHVSVLLNMTTSVLVIFFWTFRRKCLSPAL